MVAAFGRAAMSSFTERGVPVRGRGIHVRKLIVGALAAATMLVSVPVAHAAPQHASSCVLAAGNEPTGLVTPPDTYTGVLAGAAVGYDDGLVGTATVSISCVVKVAGNTVCIAGVYAGATVAGGLNLCQFYAADGDVVEICKHVVANGHDFGDQCAGASTTKIPPDEVWDLVYQVKSDVVDPPICPLLASLYGYGLGVPGVVEIDNQGGVHVLGNRVEYDCPPYGGPQFRTWVKVIIGIV